MRRAYHKAVGAKEPIRQLLLWLDKGAPDVSEDGV
jgi:hypothetical protein